MAITTSNGFIYLRAVVHDQGFFQTEHRGVFTLLETTIVLLAVAFILGGIWVAASHVMENYRISRATQQVTKIVQNIREYYMNAKVLPVAPTLSLNPSIDNGNLSLFPSEMHRMGVGGPIDHPLNGSIGGGSLQVFSESCPTPGNATSDCFRISMLGLDTGSCIKLLLAVPVNDADLGVMKVGTGNMNAATSTAAVTTPVKSDTAETWCNNGANNEVDWDFKLRG